MPPAASVATAAIRPSSKKVNSANYFALTEFEEEVRHSPGPTPMSVQDSD